MEAIAMNIRTALLVAFVPLAGCNSWPGGKSTVPPPGTGAVVAPNPYYQPSATPPAFTPPTYGAPGGAAATAPGFGSTAQPNVSLASNSQGAVFRPVTKQPTLTANNTTGTINPRTTLTSSHSPMTANGLPDITGLPVVTIPGAPQPTAPRTTYPPTAYPPATAPLMAPNLTSPPPRVSGVRDPWRGR
jgi:hypothetical protein